MTDWILENAETLFALLGAAYALALVVVKLTPTPRDDAALETVNVVVRALAALFGLNLRQGIASKPKRGSRGLVRAELLLAIASLSLIFLSGCTSPGDQYQASAIAFVAVVDAATELRLAGELDPDEVEQVGIAVDEGHKVLAAWAAALEREESYPRGHELVSAVVSTIRRYVRREED